MCFVGEKEGLNSVGDDANDYLAYDQMAQLLKPVRIEFLDECNNQKNAIAK